MARTNDLNTMNNCIDEITNSLHKIKDPGQLSNVRRWVIKLTAGEPDSLKADYLRLLEYALKSDDFLKPFDRPPPDDRLPKLHELARRPPSRRPEGRTRSALAAGGGCGNPDKARRTKDCAGNGPGNCPGKKEAAAAAAADACPELVGLIGRTNGDTASLQKFMADAQRYTCDGGRLMGQVCGQLMDDYLQSSAAVFDDRAQKLGDALAKEQVALLLRYRAAGMRMVSRAQILLDHVSELMPTFMYASYASEPDAYMRRIIAEKKNAVSGSAGPAGPADKNNDCGGSPPSGRDGDENDAEHTKLLSALVWLRSEVDRADCENANLVDRYEFIVAAISAANRKKTDNECLAKTQRNELRCQLDALRKTSAEQVALIDGYVEKISSEKSESGISCI